jgi:hypothetical protein
MRASSRQKRSAIRRRSSASQCQAFVQASSGFSWQGGAIWIDCHQVIQRAD